MGPGVFSYTMLAVICEETKHFTLQGKNMIEGVEQKQRQKRNIIQERRE